MFNARRRFATLMFFCLVACDVNGNGAFAAGTDTESQPSSEQLPNDLGFLNAHPDMRWREEGVRAYEKQRYEAALMYFRRAARYADKPSQAMLAEMYWRGEATKADRAMAYVWMDLAAERAYRPFLISREKYWAELSEAERKRAVEVGGAVFDEYEDRVAKPRLERIMERARRNVTGSRLGVVGTLSVQVRGPAGMISIPAHQYYQSKYWKADEYWEWQDEVWKAPPRGEVRVGPLIQSDQRPSE